VLLNKEADKILLHPLFFNEIGSKRVLSAIE